MKSDVLKIKASRWQRRKVIQDLRKFGISDEELRNIGVKIKNYWTKERCLKEAKKYKTRTEWHSNSSGSFFISKKNGWYEYCVKHMKNLKKHKGYWTKERCLKEAKKYKTRREWRINSSGSLSVARRSGWLKECTKHMVILQKPNGYWTKSKCVSEAKKYSKQEEWYTKSSSSYLAARKNGCFFRCIKHMENLKKPHNYWTKEKCFKEAKKCNTKKEWRDKFSASYYAAYKKGWLETICKSQY